jgi:hypothetical protein
VSFFNHHRDVISIYGSFAFSIAGTAHQVVGNIIAALEHNDHVCQIQLRHPTFLLQQLGFGSNAYCKPFPELTHLQLYVFVDDRGPIRSWVEPHHLTLHFRDY